MELFHLLHLILQNLAVAAEDFFMTAEMIIQVITEEALEVFFIVEAAESLVKMGHKILAVAAERLIVELPQVLADLE
jgi:hypothetical protein